MRSKTFLLGMLSGIGVTLGGTVLYAWLSAIEVVELSPQPVVVIPSEPEKGPETMDSEFPPGTQRREFNGMPFYIIPLADGR
jgi:hypothetical protein